MIMEILIELVSQFPAKKQREAFLSHWLEKGVIDMHDAETVLRRVGLMYQEIGA